MRSPQGVEQYPLIIDGRCGGIHADGTRSIARSSGIGPGSCRKLQSLFWFWWLACRDVLKRGARTPTADPHLREAARRMRDGGDGCMPAISLHILGGKLKLGCPCARMVRREYQRGENGLGLEVFGWVEGGPASSCP